MENETNKIAMLNDEVSAKKRELAALETEFKEKGESYGKEISIKEKHVKGLDEQIAIKEKTKDGLVRGLKELDAELAEKNADLSRHVRAIDSAKQELATVQKECDELSKRSAQTVSEVKDLVESSKKRQNEIEEREQDVGAREREATSRENAYEAKEAELLKREKAISAKESQIGLREASVEQSRLAIEKRERDCASTEIRAKSALTEADRLQNKARMEFDAYVESENKKLAMRSVSLDDKEKSVREREIVVEKRDKESILREEETKVNERAVKLKMKSAGLDAQEQANK